MLLPPSLPGRLRDIVQRACTSDDTAAIDELRAHLAQFPLRGGAGTQPKDEDEDEAASLGSPVMIAASHGRADVLEASAAPD